MKELKQWQEVYVSEVSEEKAKLARILRTFICMHWNYYVVTDGDNFYQHWEYAVPVEEVEEEVDFKIWDKVVMDLCWDSYTIIQSIQKDEEWFLYNGFYRSIFRKPTPEELEKYFRN